MGIADLLVEKIEKQMAAMNERLEAAEAEARAHRAEAESELAGAQLEEELLGRVNTSRTALPKARPTCRNWPRRETKRPRR